MNDTSFYAIVRLLLTKLNHYIFAFTSIQICFLGLELFKWTLKIGDTVPITIVLQTIPLTFFWKLKTGLGNNEKPQNNEGWGGHLANGKWENVHRPSDLYKT